MKNVAAVFTAEELSFIEQHSGAALTDERDYSDDELLDIHQALCDNAPSLVDPVFEQIIDKFYDNFEV